MDWYTLTNIDELDTPALVVYPDRIEENLRVVHTFVPDKNRLRPHIKTSKCPHVIRMMLDDGISRFKCATIAEAEMLALEGVADVLLAYQPVGPKAKRFCELQRKFPRTRFACLTDNSGSLLALAATAAEFNITVRVLIDLNTGMNRTGIAPGAEALNLYLLGLKTPGIAMAGLHSYDGHLRDPDLALRTKKCDEAFEAVAGLRSQIREATGTDPLVVAGGTPTFPIHAKRTDTECSPGTFIFWDEGYRQALKEQPFRFAALVVTRVISKPDEKTVCLDLGHKSIAAENDISRRIRFLNAPELEPIGHSEEHLVMRAPANHSWQVGDVLYGVPYHICPTVALYDEAVACRGHLAGDRWPITARRRKISL